MADVRGNVLEHPHGTTPAAVITNKTKSLDPFKSKENIHKDEDGPDCTVSNNMLSLVTL